MMEIIDIIVQLAVTIFIALILYMVIWFVRVEYRIYRINKENEDIGRGSKGLK